MSKLEFKPDDFHHFRDDIGLTENLKEHLAGLANTRLAEMLKDAKVVYGDRCGNWFESDKYTANRLDRQNYLNDKALLINIEEIKPKCVEHIPVVETHDRFKFETVKCSVCGIKLKAIFVEDK